MVDIIYPKGYKKQEQIRNKLKKIAFEIKKYSADGYNVKATPTDDSIKFLLTKRFRPDLRFIFNYEGSKFTVKTACRKQCILTLANAVEKLSKKKVEIKVQIEEPTIQTAQSKEYEPEALVAIVGLAGIVFVAIGLILIILVNI